MHNKITKAVTASLMAAAMLTTTVATIAPMSVSAGQVLGENDFTYKALPWHTCETNPAKQTFELTSDGTFHVTVKEPGGVAAGGESRWDLQFRHRNLTFKAGHTYKIHWEVKVSRPGIQINTKIGNIKGDEEYWNNNNAGPHGGGTWNPIITINSTEWQKFDSTWTCPQNLEGVEWAFHYGGAGANQPTPCTQSGDEIWFDNMSIEDTTGSEGDWKGGQDNLSALGVMNRDNSGLENNYISVNQVGYFTKLAKVATLGDNKGDKIHGSTSIELGDSALEFDLIDNATGKSVYTGKTVPGGLDADSGDNVHTLDFSDFTTAGEYYLKCGDYVSFPFKIGDDIYSESGHNMLTNAMNYYYQNRSGIDIEEKYITSGDKSSLAHIGGHKTDTAAVQTKWIKSYKSAEEATGTYKSSDITATGGWYDAGDHGKYVVNGGISVWTLQNMYERAVAEENADKFADGKGTVVIPETGNNVPDILDEAAVELDWMMEMVVQPNEPTWGKYAGLVYHKLHDHKWTGLATRPWNYDGPKDQGGWETKRIVKPPTFAATLNFVVCAAQAARLWQDIDSAKAQEYYDAAVASYAAYKEHYYEYDKSKAGEDGNGQPLYAPMDQAIGGGAYGDDNVKDDAYWAACELYTASKALGKDGDSYYKDIKDYGDAFTVLSTLEGGENNGSFGSFNWGNTASLGSLSLYLNGDTITSDELTKVKNSIVDASELYIAKEEEQGYGIPYQGTTFTDSVNIGDEVVNGFEWGSNSFAVNNAIVMAYAYDITGDKKHIDGVSTAMDYVLGRNPLSVSYVTGYGSYHISRPHHRYWSNELDSTLPVAPDGVMSGGPGAGLQDPYIQALGFKRGTLASERCYVDSIEAWSVNEVTINWNAPFAWVVSFLQDEAPNVSDSDEDKLVVTPSKVEVEVGETETLKPTVNGSAVDATFESSDDSVVTVDANGTITGVGEGTATITVTFGDKTATVNVTVTEVGTTDDTTESTGVTVPSFTGDLDEVKYGDVNVDGFVDSSDIVTLNKYLLNNIAYPLKSDVAMENANCVYDTTIDTKDSVAIINCVLQIIEESDLGPQK